MADAVRRGSCLCGAIAFSCVGAPVHFNLCQKFHGAMLGPYVWFRREQFSLRQGQDHETTYASSEWASRTFCRTCGSPFRYVHHQRPDMVFIAAGLFEALDVQPTRHIFVKDRCAWFEIRDGLPQVETWVKTSGAD